LMGGIDTLHPEITVKRRVAAMNFNECILQR
jgi:hypothetical protein